MSDSTEKATFFGLPMELRLKIYDYIIHTDTDCIILKNVLHVTGSNGTQAVLVPNARADLRARISWLDLQLTCRAIRSEMQSYMSGPSFLNIEQNRTYILDFDVYHNSGSSKHNRLMTWRRLPCAPVDASVLVINVAAKRGSGPWTDGGSASLARALYQTLNHLVHRGPLIATKRRLPTHIRLRELIINIDIGVDCEHPSLGCNTVAERNLSLFINGWQHVSKTGFMMDFLGKTKIRRNGDREDEKEIAVEWQRFPSIPGYWSGYGFQWGV